MLRDDGAQNTLAFQQRPGPQVVTIEPEHVKDAEHWLATPAHQVIEARAALRIHHDDLAIEHCLTVQLDVNGGRQASKPLHEPAALRDQTRFVLPDVRYRSEASIFNSKTKSS